jgi:hypothetical protein
MFKKIIALSFVLYAGSAAAIEGEPCPVLEYSEHSIYTLYAEDHKAIHIVLPTNTAGPPVLANPQHWKAGGSKNHIYVRPDFNNTYRDSETTLSIVTVDGSSYDFILKKAKTKGDLCLRINKDTSLDNISFQTNDDKAIYKLSREVVSLDQKLAEAEKVQEQEKDELLNNYRKNIFSNYTWKTDGDFPDGYVTSVYDDGLFTLVRISEPSRGLPQLTVVTEDEEFTLNEIAYDEFNQLFRIDGIYDRYILKSKEGEIVIKRNN